MKDRLEELQRTFSDSSKDEEKGGTSTEDEEREEEVVPQAVLFEEEPVLENFLDEVHSIRQDIADLSGKVKSFSQEQKTLVATMRRLSVMKNESSITRDVKRQAESLYKRLENLSERVKRTEAERGPSAAACRIQRAQHAALFRSFQQVMLQYNDSIVSKKDKCKQFIIRQLEVAGQEVSEEAVEEMVAQGQWEVFNENVLHEVKVTRSQLSEIEQRHKELLNLESNMKDLRDLFLEIYMLVEEQGQHIENIQANVEKTQDFVAITNQRFKMAVRYRKKNPIRKIFCCCCPWKD